MAEINSQAEIIERIHRIDARIEAVEEAQQFSLDTGQGRQSVQRARLDELYRSREYWLRKLDTLAPGGLTSIDYRRHG
jgi:hypothetical protein